MKINKSWVMNNWHIDYKVKYHITFVHTDGRTEVVNDEMIIHSRSPKQAEEMLWYRYENGDGPLIDIPDGWLGKTISKKLEIDEIMKVQSKLIINRSSFKTNNKKIQSIIDEFKLLVQ